MSQTPPAASPPIPIQTTSTFNIQNLVTPSQNLRDTPVDISRMLYMLYQDVEQQITRADLKAQITLGTSTLLAAFTVNVGLGFAGGRRAAMTPLEWTAMGFYALCAASICAAVWFALTAAFPRSVGRREAVHAKPNLYFSADIITLQPDDYVARFLGQTNELLKESVIKQVQLKAGVLERKLVFVRRGLRLLALSVLFWALGHAILIFAY